MIENQKLKKMKGSLTVWMRAEERRMKRAGRLGGNLMLERKMYALSYEGDKHRHIYVQWNRFHTTGNQQLDTLPWKVVL